MWQKVEVGFLSVSLGVRKPCLAPAQLPALLLSVEITPSFTCEQNLEELVWLGGEGEGGG